MSRCHRINTSAKLVLLLILIPLLAGCATIFSGTSDDITFTSDPEGATVYINGVQRGQTPTTVQVSRDTSAPRVRLELEGYRTEQFRLQTDFNTVSILNLGNFLFWGVDIISGAVYRYSPTSYNVRLSEGDSAFIESDSVIVLHSIPPYRIEPVAAAE